MPSVAIPISDSSNTIILPIVKAVIQEFIFSTATEKINDIIYIQRSNKNIQRQTNKPGEPLRLDPDECIIVEYSTTPDLNIYDSDKTLREYLPIYQNEKLGVSLTPMHSHRVLEMAITYRAQSYDELVRWLLNFERMTMRSAPAAIHSLTYNITIPDDVYEYLYTVWSLSETVAPYGKTFPDFLNEGFSTGLGLRGNLNNTAEKLIVCTKNTNCVGKFTTLPPEKPTTQLDPPISQIEFTYTLWYEQPSAIQLGYQKVIHNQGLDLTSLYHYADRVLHDDPMRGNKVLSANVYESAINQAGVVTYPERQVNETDGWYPPTVIDGYKVDSITPIRLDLNDLRKVVNLQDLIGLGYPQWFLNLVKSSGQLPLTPRLWFYQFILYSVDDSVVERDIAINSETGDLYSTLELNPRQRHYLVINKHFRLGTVNMSDYRKDPELLNNILNSYLPITLDTIGGGTYVTTQSLLDAMNAIQDLLRRPWENSAYSQYKSLRCATFNLETVRR